MTKKIIIYCMAIVTSISIHAQTKTVTLHYDIETTKSHRNEFPIVKYDEDEVSISSGSIIYNAHI